MVVGYYAARVQNSGDLDFKLSLVNEHLIDPVHHFDFFLRAGNNDDPVGLEVLALALLQNPLGPPFVVNHQPAKPIPGNAALPEAQPGEPAFGSLDFYTTHDSRCFMK
jgi:hypothetical protein